HLRSAIERDLAAREILQRVVLVDAPVAHGCGPHVKSIIQTQLYHARSSFATQIECRNDRRTPDSALTRRDARLQSGEKFRADWRPLDPSDPAFGAVRRAALRRFSGRPRSTAP